MCQPISKVIPSRLNLSQVVLIIRNIRSDDVYKSLIVSFFCNIICNPFFTDFDGMIAILKTKCEFKLLNEYILRNQTNNYDDNTTITSEIYEFQIFKIIWEEVVKDAYSPHHTRFININFYIKELKMLYGKDYVRGLNESIMKFKRFYNMDLSKPEFTKKFLVLSVKFYYWFLHIFVV